MPLVCVRLPRTVKDNILAAARKADRDPSDFLRRFLVKHFPPKKVSKRDA